MIPVPNNEKENGQKYKQDDNTPIANMPSQFLATRFIFLFCIFISHCASLTQRLKIKPFNNR